MMSYSALEPFLVGLIGLACAYHLFKPRLDRYLRGMSASSKAACADTTCNTGCGNCGSGGNPAPHKVFKITPVQDKSTL